LTLQGQAVHPLKQWRSWVLVLLLVGPVLAYMGLGMLWLWERGWVILTVCSGLWVISGVAFSLLAARWTRLKDPMMPPLDWESPQTFSPRDRDAWKLVQTEADRGEELTFESLLGGDTYIDTGRRLFRSLAVHYHPLAANPLDDVPLVELLTALELAAEDLSGLCRQVPGGDLITLSHWRTAVQVAGYISRANDLYTYLLPFLNPVGGLARWSTREWVVKPAWKSMQQNLLRWFFQAYVNRLGVHLIELMSGRLAIGADQYRRLTRKSRVMAAPSPDEPPLITITVAGARESGKSRLIAQLQEACRGDPTLLKARLAHFALEPALVDRLRDARWVEAPAYTTWAGAESRRDRARRQAAVEAAVAGDLLILVIDARQESGQADIAFAQAWDRWFLEHPRHEVPPALVVLTGVDRPELGEIWHPPYDWSTGQGAREAAVRSLLEQLRSNLPPVFAEFTAVGLPDQTPFGVVEHVLPAVATQLHRAERTALIRKLHEVGGRSKVGRLVRQLGQQGLALWDGIKARRKARSSSP
jgi:hypothetical protein